MEGILLLLIIGVVAYLYFNKKNNDINVFNQYKSEIYKSAIVGLKYRKNSKQNTGKFIGFLRNEPTNPVDPNAIGVYGTNEKLIGYIPAFKTEDWKELLGAELDDCVFGFCDVYYDEEECGMRGRIFVPVNQPQEVNSKLFHIFIKRPELFHNLDFS